MEIFSFEIELADHVPTSHTNVEPFAELCDNLFEAGCGDALPTVCNGVVTVGFDRESASLGAAIDSAVRDIRKAGYKVAKVVCEELSEPVDV